MGLNQGVAEPGFAAAVAPAAKGIIDPSTGKPVGANDPYFLEVNRELSDKGFFVAATDDLSVVLDGPSGGPLQDQIGFGDRPGTELQ